MAMRKILHPRFWNVIKDLVTNPFCMLIADWIEKEILNGIFYIAYFKNWVNKLEQSYV